MMTVSPGDRENLTANTHRLTRYSAVFIVLVVFATSLASADDSNPVQPMPMQSCEKDRVRFCSDKKEASTDLYRIEIGAQYFNQLPEKKNRGLRGSIGCAGDKPFANFNDLTSNTSQKGGIL
jgi:hypothetical protein